MILDYVFSQARRRVRNGIRVRDNDFTATYRTFARRARDIERGTITVPLELRHKFEDLAKHTKRAVKFRLMTNVERKKAGLRAPRLLVEPSPALRQALAELEAHLSHPQSQTEGANEKRSHRVRAAMGLATGGH